MNPSLSLTDALASLAPGRGLEVVAHDRIEDAQERDSARGLVAEEISLETLFAEPAFDRLDAPRLAEHAFHLERHMAHSRVVAVSAPGWLELETLQDAVTSQDLVVRDSVVLVDTTRFRGLCLLRLSDHATWLVLSGIGEGALDCGVVALPITLTLPDSLKARTGGDAWLDTRVRELVERGAYGAVVAAGLIVRLGHRSREDERALLGRLRAGKSLPADEPERVWAKAWEEAAASRVEQRALASAAQLSRVLATLADKPELGDAGWQAEYFASLRERDDLEGVRLLLRARGAGERLERAISRLDRGPGQAVSLLPDASSPITDEQLRRAASIDETAWWARGA